MRSFTASRNVDLFERRSHALDGAEAAVFTPCLWQTSRTAARAKTRAPEGTSTTPPAKRRHSLVNRVRAWHIAVPQVKRERAAVDFPAERRMRLQGLQLGPEQQAVSGQAVIEGLFAQPVPGQEKGARLPIQTANANMPLKRRRDSSTPTARS
jgi:hypothetical protein